MCKGIQNKQKHNNLNSTMFTVIRHLLFLLGLFRMWDSTLVCYNKLFWVIIDRHAIDINTDSPVLTICWEDRHWIALNINQNIRHHWGKTKGETGKPTHSQTDKSFLSSQFKNLNINGNIHGKKANQSDIIMAKITRIYSMNESIILKHNKINRDHMYLSFLLLYP